MADDANVGGLGDAVENMKAKMKDAPPKAAPPKKDGSLSATTACGGEAGQLRGPAESLRFLADGVAAVRPATEAEEEIKRKEKLVRERMNTQYSRIMEEHRRLEEVKKELAKMSEPMRRDVELIRERLESVGRDLAHADKDYRAKKKAFEDASTLLERKKKEKQDLADHLRLIIHESEVRKTQKLEEIMEKLGVSDPTPEDFQGF